MKSKLFIRIISILMVLALTTGFIGCGGGNNNDQTPGDEPPSVDSIVDDLPRDENGVFDVSYLENVKLNMWSVIGQPDQDKLLELVKEFNKEYAGMIEINVTSVGHYDYYNSLDSTYAIRITAV